jgi:hypothetical protein
VEIVHHYVHQSIEYKSPEIRDKENREIEIADLLTKYTLSKENFDFSGYTEEEMTKEFGHTTLTIAEYDVLSKYIREYALNDYCKKMKQYPACKERFKTILEWAIKDGFIKPAWKEDFEG